MRLNIIIRKKTIAWAAIGILVMVLFEAAQQYYYIVQFSLVDSVNISFIEVLQGQFFRWLIWSLYAIILWQYVYNDYLKDNQLNKKKLLQYGGAVFGIILCNIISITLFQLVYNGDPLIWSSIKEYFVFYSFQKSPIYLIAYTVLIVGVLYEIRAQQHDVSMQQLSKLKETNRSLYDELKNKKFADSSPIIQVKTGNRTKLVPVESIIWIEANDYCVKIHDNNGHSHTIRTTMKNLQKQLPNNDFVRIHRKAIVNKNVVGEWQLTEEPKVILLNGLQIAIAQSRLRELKNKFSETSILVRA